MHQGVLTNSLAVDEGTGPVTEAELLGTIAERDSRPVPLTPLLPLDGHPAERWLQGLPADLEPSHPTAVERWLERWPRTSIAVVCIGVVLLTSVPGIGEPEIEADLAEAAAWAQSASEPH